MKPIQPARRSGMASIPATVITAWITAAVVGIALFPSAVQASVTGSRNNNDYTIFVHGPGVSIHAISAASSISEGPVRVWSTKLVLPKSSMPKPTPLALLGLGLVGLGIVGGKKRMRNATSAPITPCDVATRIKTWSLCRSARWLPLDVLFFCKRGKRNLTQRPGCIAQAATATG